MNPDSKEKVRPQFGTRFLTDEQNVFKHNAWDNVEWTSEQEEAAKLVVEKQFQTKSSIEETGKFLTDCHTYWDSFYSKHENKFFKDRHWLFTEFPELLVSHKDFTNKDSDLKEKENSEINNIDKINIFEVGCGVGNTIFPMLRTNFNSYVHIYGCDYSSTAINILKSHELYDENKCSVFVHDISKSIPFPVKEGTIDIIVMIFVLSALKKDDMLEATSRLCKLLKPGGVILFRDYGRYDMAQLRFKSSRCLDNNFYSRGDGTLVYFFTQEEVRSIFTSCGLIEEQNLVDRRLQVNRSKQIKMYRVWIQAKYKKSK